MGAIERERKFLVDQLPEIPDDGEQIRQGYLPTDGTLAVRLREIDGSRYRLAVKAGLGARRTEVEVPIDAEQFAALWPWTTGRRIRKVRHRVPVGTLVAEIDVFQDALTGLVVVEVEADSDEALAAFVPPAWFGDEVTDDPAYTNASLAERDAPPSHPGHADHEE